jgi:hypothetical protein
MAASELKTNTNPNMAVRSTEELQPRYQGETALQSVGDNSNAALCLVSLITRNL